MTDTDEITRASEETRRILEASGAIVDGGHYVHISGLHLKMWLNKDAILPHLPELEHLARYLSRRFEDLDIEIVCAPAIGGLVVAEWVAHELGVMCAFAEHDPAELASGLRGRFVLRRGYDQLVKGRRVLVVDDCVTTGHSISEVIEAVRQCGGNVVAGGSIITAGGRTPESLGLDSFEYLYNFPRPAMWTADQCPLCRDGIPINTKFGHGAEFAKQMGNVETVAD